MVKVNHKSLNLFCEFHRATLDHYNLVHGIPKFCEKAYNMFDIPNALTCCSTCRKSFDLASPERDLWQMPAEAVPGHRSIYSSNTPPDFWADQRCTKPIANGDSTSHESSVAQNNSATEPQRWLASLWNKPKWICI